MPLPSTSEPRQRNRWPWIAIALSLGLIGTAYWRDYTEKRAIRQLEEAGFIFEKGASMFAMARRNWRNLFDRGAWKASLARRVLSKDDEASIEKVRLLRNFDALAPALRRLSPDQIEIFYRPPSSLENVDGLRGLTALSSIRLTDCASLRNLAGLQGLPHLKRLWLTNCHALPNLDDLAGLTRLEQLWLTGCPGLHNADALKRLINLQFLQLGGSPELENLDGLKGLTKLNVIYLIPCPKISKETIDALSAALPSTKICSPLKETSRASGYRSGEGVGSRLR